MADVRELRERAIKKTKAGLKEKLGRRDNLIVQTVKTIDLIDKITNLLIEQLRDWYALYFPELARIVHDPDEYLEKVVKFKTKDKFEGELASAAACSMGADFAKEDIDRMAAFAADILKLREERRDLAAYLEKLMQDEAPNLNKLIGPTISGRLITTAGSLERLASLPSSTVQVLGAEKALFAHLQKGTPAPKHGIIFSFPQLHCAKPALRGKIARKLSSKISIAAKLDFFKGEFKGDELKRKLDEEIDRMSK